MTTPRAKTMREDRFKRLVDNVCDHGGKLQAVSMGVPRTKLNQAEAESQGLWQAPTDPTVQQFLQL